MSSFALYRLTAVASPVRATGEINNSGENLVVESEDKEMNEEDNDLDQTDLFGRPWDPSGVNPTLNQSNCGGIIGASDQELFSQNGNGLVICGVDGYNQCLTGGGSKDNGQRSNGLPSRSACIGCDIRRQQRVFVPSSYGQRIEAEVSGTMSLHEESVGNDCHLVVTNGRGEDVSATLNVEDLTKQFTGQNSGGGCSWWKEKNK